jgi:exodeoxyribonuclease VII small subunit
MPLSPKAEAAPPFEAVFQELQQVVLRLEDGSLGLDEAVRLYERGTQLVRACQEAIDAAELRVTRLAAESASALSDLAADEQADSASWST